MDRCIIQRITSHTPHNVIQFNLWVYLSPYFILLKGHQRGLWIEMPEIDAFHQNTDIFIDSKHVDCTASNSIVHLCRHPQKTRTTNVEMARILCNSSFHRLFITKGQTIIIIQISLSKLFPICHTIIISIIHVVFAFLRSIQTMFTLQNRPYLRAH